MERRRITTQERIDFFFQLDHDLRNHPSHIGRERMEEIMDDEKVPWSDEAIITILLQHPERKRDFMRYTRKKGKVGAFGPRLWRMWESIRFLQVE
jgi:hypothetical protein